MLTIVEFSERNRICRSKIYEEIKSGRLVAVKAGTRTLITYEAEQAWRDSLPRLVTSPPIQPAFAGLMAA